MYQAYRDKTTMRVHALELLHSMQFVFKGTSAWKKYCHFGKVQQFTQYSEDGSYGKEARFERINPQNLTTASALAWNM